MLRDIGRQAPEPGHFQEQTTTPALSLGTTTGEGNLPQPAFWTEAKSDEHFI